MKTEAPKKEEIKRKWFLVNANDKILGRLCSRIALILIGKHKPIYTPYLDVGDYVVVINAEKIKVTGKKLKDKKYYHYSGYPGGLKTESLEKLLGRFPERVIEKAVKGMLPKNILGRKMYKKLKVYKGNEHPHQAENPETLTI